MPRLQPFTRIGSNGLSSPPSHVLLTGFDEAFDVAISSVLQGVTTVPGRAGFKYAYGSYRGVRIAVLYKPMSPSLTAVAVEELVRSGAKVFISVGTGYALSPSLNIGDIVVAASAIKDDGVSKHYMPAEAPASADFDLLEHLLHTFAAHNVRAHVGIVWSHDVYYLNSSFAETLRKYSKIAVALDMDTATLYTLSMLRKLHAVSVIVIDSSHPRGVERGELLVDSEERSHLREKLLESIERAVKVSIEALSLHYEYVKSETSVRVEARKGIAGMLTG